MNVVLRIVEALWLWEPQPAFRPSACLSAEMTDGHELPADAGREGLGASSAPSDWSTQRGLQENPAGRSGAKGWRWQQCKTRWLNDITNDRRKHFNKRDTIVCLADTLAADKEALSGHTQWKHPSQRGSHMTTCYLISLLCSANKHVFNKEELLCPFPHRQKVKCPTFCCCQDVFLLVCCKCLELAWASSKNAPGLSPWFF